MMLSVKYLQKSFLQLKPSKPTLMQLSHRFYQEEKMLNWTWVRFNTLRNIGYVMIALMINASALYPLSAAAELSRFNEEIISRSAVKNLELPFLNFPQTNSSIEKVETLDANLNELKNALYKFAPEVFDKNNFPLSKKLNKDVSQEVIEEVSIVLNAKALKTVKQMKEEINDLGEQQKILEELKFSEDILNRHHDTLILAERRYQEFQSKIEKALAETEKTNFKSNQDLSNVYDLAEYFDKYLGGKKQQLIDPNDLSFQVGKEENFRAPLESKEEILHLLKIQDYGSMENGDKTRRNTPSNKGITETEEVIISQAIKDKALELNNRPVEIFNWVRNNVEFLPTYGAIQNSDMVMLTKKGNAFDTATLLIALMRAAGIESRYVYGTIEMPVEQAMKWLSVSSPEIALSILGQGGIPVLGLTSGGKIKTIRMEHVWAEIHIQYYPHKGSKHISGATPADTWVPLDASYKEYKLVETLNLLEALSFDGDQLRQVLLDGANVNLMTGQYGNLNSVKFNEIIGEYIQNNALYITQNYSEQKIRETFRVKEIVSKNILFFPSSLPYKLTSVATRFDALPVSLKMQVNLRLYTSDYDLILDNPSFQKTLSLPQVGIRRIGISYVPARESDSVALGNMVNNGINGELTPYLVNVKPQLKLDESVIGEGAGVMMASDQTWEIELVAPWRIGKTSKRFNVIAGGEYVLGVNGGVVSEAIIKERFKTVDTSTAAENMNITALYYWLNFDMMSNQLAHQSSSGYQLVSGFGLFSVPLMVTKYFFNIPRSGYYNERHIDIPHLLIASEADAVEKRIEFNKSVGAYGSLLEGAIPEQMFGYKTGMGVSAMQLIADAQSQGIPLMILDQSNASSGMAAMVMSSNTRVNITNAIHAHKTVITPQRPPEHLNYEGTGYIILDSETGMGSYMIEGGASGGALVDCQCVKERKPLQVAMKEYILTAMFIMLFLLIMAGIIWISGGAGTPTAPAVASYLMAVLGITALSFPARAEAASQHPPACCFNPASECEKNKLYRGGSRTSPQLERIRLNWTNQITGDLIDEIGYQLTDPSITIPPQTSCFNVDNTPSLANKIIVIAGSGGASHMESIVPSPYWVLPEKISPSPALCLLKDKPGHWILTPRTNMTYGQYCDLLRAANGAYNGPY